MENWCVAGFVTGREALGFQPLGPSGEETFLDHDLAVRKALALVPPHNSTDDHWQKFVVVFRQRSSISMDSVYTSAEVCSVQFRLYSVELLGQINPPPPPPRTHARLSPWIGDYGWFMVGPQMGGLTTDPVGFWEPRGATLRPYLFDTITGPDGMRIGQRLALPFDSILPKKEKKHIQRASNTLISTCPEHSFMIHAPTSSASPLC
jgi:hypothetical protein